MAEYVRAPQNGLPQRKQRDETLRRQKHKSDKDILLQMGFSLQRAEKAIAATGDHGVQVASDWLLSHASDHHIDDCQPREYIMYLCPVGELNRQIEEFAEKSLKKCGWNGSHSFFPHITLSPYFKVDDNKVHLISAAMESIKSILSKCPGKLKLDFFSQANFIGLFVAEDFYTYLTSLVKKFVSYLQKEGVAIESQKKQLHLTLAYQYQTDNHEKLLKMAKEIDISSQAHWELRVYSRNTEYNHCELRKVIKAYTPQYEDELDLIAQDFIYLDPKTVTSSTDGWYEGVSWLTGCKGLFPGVFTERTAETCSWVLHRKAVLRENSSEAETGASNGVLNGNIYDNVWSNCNTEIHHDEKGYAIVNKTNKPPSNTPRTSASTTSETPPVPPPHNHTHPPPLPPSVRNSSPVRPAAKVTKPAGPRKLLVMRHAERMDFVFGKDWVNMCFTEEGQYKRHNLNMPKEMYTRKIFYEYIKDPPLTEVGKYQARLTGIAMREAGYDLFCIYSSPSLRCVQTATEVFSVFNLKWKIRIDPGLFEWTGHTGVPFWMSPDELAAQGFPIDTVYNPQVPIKKLDEDETIDDLYKRSSKTAQQILANHSQEGGNLLFIGHAGTLDLCTRSLIGKLPRSQGEYRSMLNTIPYCSTCVIEEETKAKKWKFIDSKILPISNGRNQSQNFLSNLQDS